MSQSKKNRGMPSRLEEQQLLDDQLHEARKNLRKAKAAKQLAQASKHAPEPVKRKSKKTPKAVPAADEDDEEEDKPAVPLQVKSSIAPPIAIPIPESSNDKLARIVKQAEVEDAPVQVPLPQKEAPKEEEKEDKSIPEKKAIIDEGKHLDSDDVINLLDEMRIIGKNRNNTSVGDSLDELRIQLGLRLIPVMRQYFKTLYKSKEENTKKFKEALKEIPNWNEKQIRIQAKEFTKASPEVITLCDFSYAANLMLLADILQREKGASNLEVPLVTFTSFVHKLYIESAKQLGRFPGIMKYEFNDNKIDTLQKIEGRNSVHRMFQDSIANAIRNCIDLTTLTKLREIVNEGVEVDDIEETETKAAYLSDDDDDDENEEEEEEKDKPREKEEKDGDDNKSTYDDADDEESSLQSNEGRKTGQLRHAPRDDEDDDESDSDGDRNRRGSPISSLGSDSLSESSLSSSSSSGTGSSSQYSTHDEEDDN